MEQRASLTAQGIAILRAVESAKPPGERLFDDPFARQFVGPWMLSMTSLFIRSGYAEWRGPGVQGYLLARTRYFDDTLIQCLDPAITDGAITDGAITDGAITDGAITDGAITQLVILGAGYDARAYRFADRLAGRVRVFEVDHPATQAAKLTKLHKIFERLPDHVTYVAVDFDREDLSERLAAAGYDPAATTLFLWEGVIMYLTPAAVNSTLAFISGRAAPGSAVIIDYVYKSVIEGRVRRGEATSMCRYRRLTGEGLIFGIQEGTVEQFLEQRGFIGVHDATSAELERLYFSHGPHTGLRVAPVYAIATATVGPRITS